jgi:hypothetical protein
MRFNLQTCRWRASSVGFGYSDAPVADKFDYTLDNLAAHAAMRVEAEPPERDSFGVDRYSGVIYFRLNP